MKPLKLLAISLGIPPNSLNPSCCLTPFIGTTKPAPSPGAPIIFSPASVTLSPTIPVGESPT